MSLAEFYDFPDHYFFLFQIKINLNPFEVFFCLKNSNNFFKKFSQACMFSINDMK